MSLQFLNTNDLGEGFCKQYGGSLKVRRGGTKWWQVSAGESQVDKYKVLWHLFSYLTF